LAVFLLLCGGSAWAQDACDCRHVDALQAELRNALTLQSNFRKEIPHLRQFSEESSQMELKKFAAGRARRDVKTIPGYKGPDAVDYTPQGDFMGTTEGPAEKLCRMADSAAAQLNQAARATACVGIGESLRAHEAVHSRMCHRIGYAAYLRMHGADRAQEEVEAYGAQIAVLKGPRERRGTRRAGNRHPNAIAVQPALFLAHVYASGARPVDAIILLEGHDQAGRRRKTGS
jgi:hypothetical protein